MQTTTPQAALPLLHDEAGSGPTLVLLPGAHTPRGAWQPAAAALVPTRRVVRLRLLAVELADAGCALPDTYSRAVELDALEAALVRLADEPVDLVGWSDAAALAQAHARRHPATVRTLTLVDPPTGLAVEPLRRAVPTLTVPQGDDEGFLGALTSHLGEMLAG